MQITADVVPKIYIIIGMFKSAESHKTGLWL